jgi:hypothetical protein
MRGLPTVFGFLSFLSFSRNLLYSIRLCLWQIERLLLQSDLRLFACLASPSALLTSTLGYPYLRRYSRDRKATTRTTRPDRHAHFEPKFKAIPARNRRPNRPNRRNLYGIQRISWSRTNDPITYHHTRLKPRGNTQSSRGI